jgi:hypothetical protein
MRACIARFAAGAVRRDRSGQALVTFDTVGEVATRRREILLPWRWSR